MEQKSITLIENLIKKTRNRLIKWKPSSEVAQQFVLQMSAGTLLVDQYGDGERYSLIIINTSGARIDVADSEHCAEYHILTQKLYHEAENSYLQIDETIDAIIQELDLESE